MVKDITTIQIEKSTLPKLKELGIKGQTYDTIINVLILKFKEAKNFIKKEHKEID